MEQLLAVDAAAFKDIENVTSTEDRMADSLARGGSPRREDRRRGPDRIDEGHLLAENPR
ncbi:hypothetical protein PC118_g11666 [Phytophthora cactorum]|nr:hypothetical protein PC111_g10387 [Phytophthora cactorum]KAG2837138.1 hypothetical protein PC112_g5004 [Phytophthora cactorum]KAG2867833.1 hypothetical protein PC113_g1611 [Phytophthora cactorum]KAG2888865.1 hypothetical protein PC115_g19913 [Phytophthora cactorum]KAG2898690.1 hypothetical protein PC117_g22469 [Phytophthora cactorum]